ncbi:hypothetical protein [Pseudoalteromonas luteoviolacea]|uniref:hypothetical protein n=1 Tax=Pseudoalteromonas luteoviolacea TaxID=43657 RepID=UPI00115307B2|nr:hypothetical protein [Pseudoalteromonas luteoviolacea]TQF72936.1 hypothetical protein FLM44_18705 [Pseudoalteromonas luteoviolacea]
MMYKGLYISDVILARLDSRSLALEPRERFVVTQQDIHRMAGIKLEHDSMFRGDQYNHVDLFDPLYTEVPSSFFDNIQLAVMSYWIPEFDPEYSAFGTYVQNKCELSCPFLDVSERGSLSPNVALTVAMEYALADDLVEQALLMAFEQSTVPVAENSYHALPKFSSSGIVKLTAEPEGNHIKLLASRVISEFEVSSENFKLAHYLEELLEQLGVPQGQVILSFKRNTSIFKTYNYHLEADCLTSYAMDFVDPAPSCMTVMRWLHQKQHTPIWLSEFAILIDEDEESLSAHCLVIQNLAQSGEHK